MDNIRINMLKRSSGIKQEIQHIYVRTSLGNDKHISDVELREADQLKSLTLDPPAKFGVGDRIWSL